MKKFADFWRGIFYLTSTVVMGVLLYLLVIVWQPLWSSGFKDFGKISQAIENLDATTKPAVGLVPQILSEMQHMNQHMGTMETSIKAMDQNIGQMDKSIQRMDQNMAQMDKNIAQMRDVMTYQMGLMNYQVDRMSDKMSPMGMMPFNW